MKRAAFSSSIIDFGSISPNEILGQLTQSSSFAVEQTQVNAWLQQIDISSPFSGIEVAASISNSKFHAWVSALTESCSLAR